MKFSAIISFSAVAAGNINIPSGQSSPPTSTHAPHTAQYSLSTPTPSLCDPSTTNSCPEVFTCQLMHSNGKYNGKHICATKADVGGKCGFEKLLVCPDGHKCQNGICQ